MVVTIYSTPTCPHCIVAKEFFKEKGIKYKDIDVSKDEKAAEEMVRKSGQRGVPVIDIDGKIIVGFERDKVAKLLGIKD
ncbi:MAG TPA: NrdH-redoxin [Candidatus Pacearchaeota archaeon]|nr:glutaredoxin-3 [archaeon BMS3Abin17]HDK42251.1 NrdH-redoxin [Candidatus Pacearchaeota archaeon]HDZ60944.1 NrdH-redoxin [Candidatus Pacearchaeota archaeon]